MEELLTIKKGSCKTCFYGDNETAECTLKRSCYLSTNESYGLLILEYYRKKNGINTKWKLMKRET